SLFHAPATPDIYTLSLHDALPISPDNFPVKGDGIADDTAVLQQAINKVQEKTNQGILFIPAGRYRLTRTIYIWPGIRLIGFGTTDRKSTRLNSSHVAISYAVFCLK